MRRDAEQDLLHWKEQANRLPLLLRGARQVGKSYLVEMFGREHFDRLVIINFELQPSLARCFDELEPQAIINAITMLTGQKIESGKTLLFLDEIQECPNAIRALRYFKEKIPALHVIGAGSLLEFTLNSADFRMPVGRVQSLYIKPLSFKEYLTALGYAELREFIETTALDKGIAESIHEKLLTLVKEYMLLGGMPAVVQAYIDTHQFDQVQRMQTVLLNTYQNDFGKYATRSEHRYLRRLFEKIPGFIAQRIKYVQIDPEVRSRELKEALMSLRYAGLIYPVYSTAGSGLPLVSLVNEKKMKLLFLDIGLTVRSMQLEAELLLKENILLVNRGTMAEQFVGQELLVYASRLEEAAVYFWCREERSSQAEIDFLTTVGVNIIPIEVKAGVTGQLKSLHLFMKERGSSVGVRVSQHPLAIDGKILSIPLYMVSEVARLTNDFLQNPS